MNENIFTEELSKERVTLFNKAVIDTVKKCYPKETYGMDILMLVCRAVRAGEAIFSEKFISDYAKELKSRDTNRISEILNSKVLEAKECYFVKNNKDIDTLPPYIKENKEVFNTFIHNGICDGLIISLKTLSRLMKVAT